MTRKHFHSARHLVFVFATSILLVTANAHAGPAFFAGRLENGRFVRDPDVKESCYTVRYSSVTATVEGDVATVKIQETITGSEHAVRAVCLIPLCGGADGQTVTVSAGKPNDTLVAVSGAKYLKPDEAQSMYESLAQGMSSVTILSLSGRPALLIPDFELQGSVEMVVEFRQQISEHAGLRRWACPMPATAWARGPVERLTVNATIRSPAPLRAVFSPTHNAVVQRQSLQEAIVSVKANPWSGRDDFRLLWVADQDDLGLRVLAHRDEGDDEGYFLLVGNPTGSAGREARIDKDVVFVLDTSGSMRGEKIEQARAALAYCIRQLNAQDRFNIITFGTTITSFRDTLAEQTPANVDAAEKFVEELVANGRTNISGALATALLAHSTPGRPRIVIFLTDGTPTAGELVNENIVAQVRQANPSGTRIFVMGVGHDVNAHLLDQLAEVSDGSSEYAGPGEELDAKIAALYDRLANPVLTGVTVSFGDLVTNSVYPQKLPVLFKGSEVMLAGRYRGGGPATFTVSGTLAGKSVQYVCRIDLPQHPRGLANDFVPTLWASRKIGYLLQEIRLHGENQELIEEVVRLSKRFGIVTEYTEFIALAAADVSAETVIRQARAQMATARAQQAGQWAVNQAFNDQQLQNRAVASREANTYRDRRGKVVNVDNVTQVGRQVFYLREGQWVDAEDVGDRKQRVVKLFSPEYFALLHSSPVFAQSQQLGWAVSVNVRRERIVVEKDGQQNDEQLRRRAEPAEELQQQPFNQLNQQPQQMLQNQQFQQRR